LEASPLHYLGPLPVSISFRVATTTESLVDFADMNPATFDEHFPGAPRDGELRRQCLRAGSAIGARLYKLVSPDELMPAYTARELIAIMLVMGESRKATEAEIIKRARNLPFLCRVLAEGTTEEKEGVETLLVGIWLSCWMMRHGRSV
jgi:hypothetical protein